jgi:hypothetical protein
MIEDQLATKISAGMKPECSLLLLVAVQGQLNPAIMIQCFFNLFFNIILISSAVFTIISCWFPTDIIRMYLGYTNTKGQVALATKSYRGVQYFWVQSVAPVILTWLLYFWKPCAGKPLMYMSSPSRVLHGTPTSRSFNRCTEVRFVKPL